MRAMAPPPSHAAALAVTASLLLFFCAAAVAAQAQLGADSTISWPSTDAGQGGGVAMPAPYCTGPAEQCVAAAADARRELGSNSYISYDAMRRNSVPCSYRGASYYNCRPGGQANPYSRGCSSITQCRG